MQREDIILQTNQHAARRIPANTAVGDFYSGKTPEHIIAPTLRDRVTCKNQCILILRNALRPGVAALEPNFPEPIVTPNRSGSGQTSIAFRNLQVRAGRLSLNGLPLRRHSQ